MAKKNNKKNPILIPRLKNKARVNKRALALMLFKSTIILAATIGLIVYNAWFALIYAGIVLWMVLDLLYGIVFQKPVKGRPDDTQLWNDNAKDMADLLWVIEHPTEKHPEILYTSEALTEKQVYDIVMPSITWINNRYDCTDFRANRLIRFAIAFRPLEEKVSPSGKVMQLVDEALLGMKFWMTEGGDDGACYHTENHQLAYFSAEYIIGRMYHGRKFADGKVAEEKEAEGRRRLIDWLDLRLKYGFSEFYAHNYVSMNFGGLSMILLHGDRTDYELMTKTRSVLDLLCLDYSFMLFEDSVVGAQGRAYARNNLNCAKIENNSAIAVDCIWNGMQEYGKYYRKGQMIVNFINLLLARDDEGKPIYEVPKCIVDIGNIEGPMVIKTASGLDLQMLKRENLYGHSDKQIMFQFGMCALSNPQIVNNTIDYFNRYRLLKNGFINPFKYFNISFLRWLGVLPFISRHLDIYPNGMALEKANVYAYRTKDYKLVSLQGYNPGSFGAQQTTMSAVLPGGITVYTHHPFREDRFNDSPGFWGGYGVAPHCVQNKNVCMMIHHIPGYKPFLSPRHMLPYTHTFFSEELLDECIVDGNYAFCRKEGTYLALISTKGFEYLPHDERKTEIMEGLLKDKTKRFELIQKGRNQATIYEFSTKDEDGSFETFIQRIKSNEVSFAKGRLIYSSNGQTYNLKYLGEFKLNDEIQPYEFERFDCEFAKTKYLDNHIEINVNGSSLQIDGTTPSRVVKNSKEN